ncbi:MAG: hypothetical protein IJZ81_04585 [Clostridia bacterium]|nr:hypothetical protein [Clostridia bacterium]
MEVIIPILLMIIVFFVVMETSGHIPKTGRWGDVHGNTVTAIITNENKTADKAVTLRAKGKNGRKFKVKLKATEAKLWIKGDEIQVILSDNPKKYRVLFHEYFKNNRERIRQHALNLVEKKVSERFIAARLVEYKKTDNEYFKASKIDSQELFVFMTFMRMIDIYCTVGVMMAGSFLWWFFKKDPTFNQYILPLAVLIILGWVMYKSVNICKRIIETAKKSAKKKANKE